MKSIMRLMMFRTVFLLGAMFMAPAASVFAQGSAYSPQRAPLPAAQLRLIEPSMVDHEPGWLVSGIEIILPQGAKTYWRTAGETGAPPQFSFDGSRDLNDFQILYPAPQVFDDGAGGQAYGYLDKVVFPLRFKKTTSGPAHLDVRLNYGLCLKNICIPAEARLETDIGTTLAAAPGDPALLTALATVPQPIGLNGAGALAIESINASRQGQQLVLTIDARIPAESQNARLFVESDAGIAVTETQKMSAGKIRFMARSEREGTVDKSWGAALMTLAIDHSGRTQAIETPLDLDPLLKAR